MSTILQWMAMRSRMVPGVMKTTMPSWRTNLTSWTMQLARGASQLWMMRQRT